MFLFINTFATGAAESRTWGEWSLTGWAGEATASSMVKGCLGNTHIFIALL
jgi:hypothetical protein